jgi:hypothetical protein
MPASKGRRVRRMSHAASSLSAVAGPQRGVGWEGEALIVSAPSPTQASLRSLRTLGSHREKALFASAKGG